MLILIFRLIKKNIIKNFQLFNLYFFVQINHIIYVIYILYIFIVFCSIYHFHGTYRPPLAYLRVRLQSSLPPFPKRSV